MNNSRNSAALGCSRNKLFLLFISSLDCELRKLFSMHELSCDYKIHVLQLHFQNFPSTLIRTQRIRKPATSFQISHPRPHQTMAMLSFNNYLFSALFFFDVLLLSSLPHHRANSVPIHSQRRSLGANATAVLIEFLRAHNTVRSRHGLPHLKWSTSLANYAKW